MGAFGKTDVPELFVSYLTGDFAFSQELQAFWMALQGAVAVRSTYNKDRSMNWFHAFLMSVVAGYGGACFTPWWMGMPTSMLSNDLNLAACIVAYVIVNHTPFDIGYKLGKSIPIVIITTSFAQLFRSLGVVKYTSICFNETKGSPSAYYPTPIFGPIAYGTLLGNMSGFFMKGFNGYLASGMPWAFQNGLFCCTLYHFFVHDIDGPIGAFLRRIVPEWCMGGLDDATFGCVCVGAFMQICGFLQMPFLLGPSFSPFHALMDLFGELLQQLPKAEVNPVPEEGAPVAMDNNGAVLVKDGPSAPPQAKRKRRSRNKKKQQ